MVILIVIMFVIIVMKIFNGVAMMCDGGLAVSRCSRVCVYECVVWKCDPPIGDCHRANSVTTAPKHCHTNTVKAQNYDESAPIGVDRQKQRAIFVARCRRLCTFQYSFYGQFLEHFFPFSFVLTTFFERRPIARTARIIFVS